MEKPARFSKTDKWMLGGSAICLAFMLALALYVGRAMRSEASSYSPTPSTKEVAESPNRASASVHD